VGKEKVVELELRKAPVRRAQALLRLLGVVHEEVWDEPELPGLLHAHRAVRDGERVTGGDVESRLVRADRTDAVSDDAARKLVSEVGSTTSPCVNSCIPSRTQRTVAPNLSANTPLER
jgi:hypothetical protein